jgi:protease-4
MWMSVRPPARRQMVHVAPSTGARAIVAVMPPDQIVRALRRTMPGVTAGGSSATAGLRSRGTALSDAVRTAAARRGGPLVLTLDLTRPLRPESPGPAALRTRGRPTLGEVIDALGSAATDPRVAALHARVGEGIGGLATVQELAAAVRAFADTGRPCIAHADAFGESGNGTVAYLLASAFGEVHLQPTGDLALMGVAAEVTFLRGALDRAGIEPQFDQRHEYKNAAHVLTERGFTAAHREALDSLVDDWAGQIITAVAGTRDLDVADVRAAMDSAPLLAEEASQRGLVDRLAYLDESLDDLRGRFPGDVSLLPVERYVRMMRLRWWWRRRRAPQVTVLDATGPITVRGGGLLGAGVTSDRVCADLRRVAADDDVAAVILRVDSPGGSVVASDAIRREVQRTRDRGTPVIAWMGDVAASGGYYIAMAADRIVARPGTITGSIGVISGKAVRTGLEERLGVHTEAVTRGTHARFHSSASPFTSDERARLARQLDHIYEDFITKVAHDRNLPSERVDRVARGRVWTGAQAHTHGLVDLLGGHREVLDAVRACLGVEPDATLRLRRAAGRSVLARLRGERPRDPAQHDIGVLLSAAVPTELASWLRVVDLTLHPPGPLTMPWVPRLR